MLGFNEQKESQPAPPQPVKEGALSAALDYLEEFDMSGAKVIGRADDEAVTASAGFSPAAGVPDAAIGSVSRTTAISFAAIHRCVAIIASTISSLPIDVRARPSGQRPGPVLTESPYYDLLSRESLIDTSRARTFRDFLASVLADMLTMGNAFAVIERDATGMASGLTLLDPALVDIEFGADDRLTADRGLVNFRYRILDGGGEGDTFAPSEVLHFRMPSLHSRHTRNPFARLGHRGRAKQELAGTSPLVALASQIDTGVAAEQFISAYFKAGGFQDFITSDQPIADDQKKDILKYLARIAKSDMARRLPVVLGNGATMGRVESSAQGEDLERLRYQNIGIIAATYGIPTFLLSLPQTSWGSGIAELGISFWRLTLQPIASALTVELAAKLPRNQDVCFEFDHRTLTRATAKEEAERVIALVGGNNSPGIITPNEGRAMLGLPPIDGGDQLTRPAAYSGQTETPPAADADTDPL